MISNEYLKETLKESNNNKHKIRIFNITKNIDITDFLENNSLNINKNLKNGNNTITPNNVSLNFYKKDITIIEKDDLIKITDTFLNTKLYLFLGKVYEVRETLDYVGNRIQSVNIKDETVQGYETKFYEDTTYINKWYYKGTDKENSILWILAKKLGFEDNKIDIEEIKYSSGEYISNSVIKINKGSTVMRELGELVASICGEMYVKGDGTLRITSLLNQTDTNFIDYTLSIKKGNILKYIETKENTPKEDMVVIDYTEYRNLERQPIFILMGQNGDNARDLANINLRANTPKQDIYWKISYITENVANIDKDSLEIRAYYFSNETTKEYFDFRDYEIDYDKKTLRLWNSRNKEVFIEKFKIYGVPIKELKDNTVKYSEIRKENELDYNILNIRNKYINDNRLAVEMSKYKYFSNCRTVNKYKLVTNSIPFIELEDVIYLDFKGTKKKVQVVGIVQHHNETELELIDYIVYRENPINVKSYKTNEFEEGATLGGNVKYGDIELDPQAPPVPTNLMAFSDLLAVRLKWEAPQNYKEIRGYYLYITNTSDNLENKIFVGNVDNYYVKLPIGEYNFRLKTVNLKGVESDFTPYVRARALTIGATNITLDTTTLQPLSNGRLGIKDGGVSGRKIRSNAIEAKHIHAEAITAEKIGASVIQAHHIQSNSIRTEHLIADSISVDKMKFGEDLGLERVNFGTEEQPNYKLRLNGNIEFANDVEIKGKVKGGNELILENEDKKINIKSNGIFFSDYDKSNARYYETRAIRKYKTGEFSYNENTKNQWLDIRSFESEVWGNIDIQASLKDFVVTRKTKRIFTEVVRNPNNKYLFRIKVGGTDVESRSNITYNEKIQPLNRNSLNKDIIKQDKILLYEKTIENVTGFYIEIADKLEMNIKYWYDGTTSSNIFINRYFPLEYIIEYSYRKSLKNSEGSWSENILGKSADLSLENEDTYLYDFRIKIYGKLPPFSLAYKKVYRYSWAELAKQGEIITQRGEKEYLYNFSLAQIFYGSNNRNSEAFGIAFDDIWLNKFFNYTDEHFTSNWWKIDWENSGTSYANQDFKIKTFIGKEKDIVGGTAIWTATEY